MIKHDLGIDVPFVRIIPFSDMHMGSPAFADRLFHAYRSHIIETPNTYCVINGDTLEFVTRSSVGDVFDTLRPREQRKLAVKMLKPLADAGKILAYQDGNHEGRAKKEADEYLGEEICYDLGIPSLYSPDGVYIFLNVGYDKRQSKKTRLTYTIYMLHGWTAARTIGGKFNNLASMGSIAAADIYIASHTHQKGAFPLMIMFPDTRAKKLTWRKQLYVSTASFMEYDGYGVRSGYRPTALGSPCIELCGTRRKFHASV